MHLLELFAGTKSVGRVFEANGWRVTSVDLEPKFEPTIVCNVLDFNPEEMVDGNVDLVWMSPPCTHYSRARTTGGPRDLEGSDRLVSKALEIAGFYGAPFFMENPDGLLKTREIVRGIPMQVVDYCSYGYKYRKRTNIWTNTAWKPERPLCDKRVCHACVDGKHMAVAQRGPSRGGLIKGNRQDQLYTIPEELIQELCNWAGRGVIGA